MPRLGAHVSVAGGLSKAFHRMKKIEGQALQIFTRNQRQWHAKSVDDQEAKTFTQALNQSGTPFIASHASYLINLGSHKRQMAERSVLALAQEMVRCSRLTIPWVVVHPGSHLGKGIKEGIKNVATNLERAIELAGSDCKVGILLETVAGQGTGIGSRFSELAEIIALSKFVKRLGVCVDTCHIFAAGYDIRTEEAYQNTMATLHKNIGLERVKLFHLNDSKREIGSRVDRHEHIGKGKIGVEGFSFLLNDPRFSNHPMVLETPKGKEMIEDIENLKLLRTLIKKQP